MDRQVGLRVLSGLLAFAMIQVASRAVAGVADTPLPLFADGKTSVAVLVVPGVVKRGRLQTDFLCTSRASGFVNIGVEIFDTAGTRLNDVSAGVGAVLNVSPLQTVTIGTSATLAFLETTTIPLAAVDQGSARVVASTGDVQCGVLLVDDAVTPPTALGTLGPGVEPGPGPGLPGAALPQFADGQPATHAAVFPGVVKRGRMETNVFCTSLAPAPIDLGVEVFGSDGTRQNDIAAGNGAVLAVAPGATVTFGTTGTLAFLETAVIALPGVAQGVARVVSTSGAVRCAAQIVDSALAPPVAISELVGSAPAAAAGTATPTATPTPTATATATATSPPLPALVLDPIPGPILVGGTNTLTGSGFSPGSVILMFVATSTGAQSFGPFTPAPRSPTSLTWFVPASVPLGNGFVTVLVVNTDEGFRQSNSRSQLLFGNAALNLPTITTVNGVLLRPVDPRIPVANVETVVAPGSTVALAGTGFNAPLVNLFTAAGNVGPLAPLAGGTATQIQLAVPAGTVTGPGAFQVVNNPFTGNVISNAVSVPIGARITVTTVAQTGSTVTVTGAGFSSLTVINFFNRLPGGGVANLGSLAAGVPKIPLTIVSPTQFTFTVPPGAVSGPAYVQAINPPYIPFSSSGNDPGGAFSVVGS